MLENDKSTSLIAVLEIENWPNQFLANKSMLSVKVEKVILIIQSKIKSLNTVNDIK